MSLLRMRSVGKSYGRGATHVPVLTGASLTVEPGSLTSVYGAPRSGKSTLLRLAAGFERPDAGEILFGDRQLDASAERNLSRGGGIGWVLDDRSTMRHLDVATRIALPLYRELGQAQAHLRARDALRTLDCDRYADEQWDLLDAATRMLCSIAQAMARQPKLLIADDPTAGLGLVDRARVCGALRAAAEHDGLGVLIAVPDMPSMLGSHQALVLGHGRLIGAPSATPLDGNVVRLLRGA